MNEPKRPPLQSVNTPKGGDLGTPKTIQSELLSNQMAQERVLGDKSFSQSSGNPAPALRQKPKNNLLLRTLVGGGLLLLAGVAIYFGLLAYRKNVEKTRLSGLSTEYGTTSFDLGNLNLNAPAEKTGLVVINGNTTVNGDITANSYSGSGADLSNVNASLLNSQPASFYQDANNLTSGTLSDARLSGNVALLNVSQAFTGDNTFSGNSSFVKLMVSGTTTLNGTVVINNSLTTSGDTTVGGTLGVNGLVYSWPGVQANGILANDGAGNLAWQAVGACASCITNGGNAFGSSISIGTNDANTLSLRTNGSDQLTIDTTGQVGIGTNPGYKLDVNGDVNIAAGNAFRIGGTAICTSGGCAAQSGSGSYVQNSATLQTGVNFNFEIASINSVGGVIRAKAGQVSDLQQWQDSGGVALAYVDSNGDITANSALKVNGTTVCTASGCTATGGSGSYIQNGTTLQTTANFNIQSASASSVVAVLRAATGQTANLLQFQNQSGIVIGGVASSGSAWFGGTSSPGGRLGISPDTAASLGLVVQGRVSQTANLQEWQDSSGSALSYVDSSGNIAVDHTGKAILRLRSTNSDQSELIFGTGTSNMFFFDPVGGGIRVYVNASERARFNTTGTFQVNSPTNTVGTVEKFRVNTPTIVDNLANVIFSASAATSKPLVIQGAAGQSANLQEWQNSSGIVISSIQSTGSLYSPSAPIKLGFNVALQAEYSAGGGFVNLAYRGSGNDIYIGDITNGTTKVQASTYVHLNTGGGSTGFYSGIVYPISGSGYLGNGFSSPWKALYLQSINTTSTPLFIRANASQTANLSEWQDSTGVVLAKVDSLGRATFGSSSTGLSGVTATGTYAGLSAASYGGTAIYANAQSTATVGLKVQSASVLYTGDLQRWDPGGVTASSVTNSGFFKIGATGTLSTVEKLRISDPTTADNSANVMIATSAITSKGLVIQGTSSQTANLQEWQDSTGTVLASVNSAGRILVGDTSSGGIRFGSLTGSLISQTGTNITWSTPTGGYLFLSANPTGIIYLGTASDTAGIQLRRDTQITSNNAAITKLAVKGATSQTANLQEWQDSAGVVKSLVDSSGRIVVGSSMNSIPAAIGINNYTTTSNDLVIQHGDSFGGIVMVNYGTPGSNFGGKLTLGHADGTFASPTQPGSGRIVGTVNFNAWETGSSFQNVASIQAAVDTASGTGDWPGRLVFNTTPDGSTTPAERMRIDNAGNIYIGNGATSATPTSGILGATGGAGTNIAGANLTLAGGRGTGTGVGGNIVFQYAAAGVSGAAANTLTAACTISGTNGSLSCPGAGVNSQRFGSGSTAAANTSVAVGYQSQAFAGANSVAIGANSSVYTTGGGGIAIGGSSIAGCLFGCAGNSDAISIGNGSQAGGNYSIIIGNSTLSYTYNGVIALGTAITPTAANQLVIGSSTSSITNGYIGNGVTNAAPAGFSLNATGGLGSNIAGANLTFAGGISTGSANGGALNFQTSKASGSSSSANSLSTVFSLSGGLGAATFQNTANGTGAFIITDSAATNNVVNVDTTNDRVAIGAGTANPTVTLDVLSAGADSSTVAQFKNAGATSCTVQPGGTGFACSSDARLKTNVLTLSDASDVVNKLRGVSFNWITNPNGQGQSGFIAQELEQLIPNAVSTDSNGYKVANYSAIIPYLVEALKQQQTDITALKAGQTPQGGTSVDVLKILADAKVVSLSGDLTVGGNVAVKGRLETSNANSGVVIIPAGQTTIHVTYPQVFSIAPRPSLTPKGVVKTYFGVTNETKTGFDIELSDPLTTDSQFNWQAF